jgi:hypothetical protein
MSAEDVDRESLDIFERAFREPSSGCVRICHCGRTYINLTNHWDWEPGEVEKLKTEGAVEAEYALSMICFEAKEFVDACSCWHKRAARIINFIDSHGREVAAYLNAQKKRKLREAENAPAVD